MFIHVMEIQKEILQVTFRNIVLPAKIVFQYLVERHSRYIMAAYYLDYLKSFKRNHWAHITLC